MILLLMIKTLCGEGYKGGGGDGFVVSVVVLDDDDDRSVEMSLPQLSSSSPSSIYVFMPERLKLTTKRANK